MYMGLKGPKELLYMGFPKQPKAELSIGEEVLTGPKELLTAPKQPKEELSIGEVELTGPKELLTAPKQPKVELSI